MDPLKIKDHQRFRTVVVPVTKLPRGGLNEFNLFNYSHRHGHLLTELTTAHTEFTGDTQILGVDCKIVGVQPAPGVTTPRDAVARVSIVNEYGFCLYDKWVTPTRPIVDWGRDSNRISSKCLENADSHDNVVREVQSLVQGRILVGLKLKRDLDLLEISHPKEMTRDIGQFIAGKFGPFPPSPLKIRMREVVKAVFDMDMVHGDVCSIKNAQAAIVLYDVFYSEMTTGKENKKGQTVEREERRDDKHSKRWRLVEKAPPARDLKIQPPKSTPRGGNKAPPPPPKKKQGSSKIVVPGSSANPINSTRRACSQLIKLASHHSQPQPPCKVCTPQEIAINVANGLSSFVYCGHGQLVKRPVNSDLAQDTDTGILGISSRILGPTTQAARHHSVMKLAVVNEHGFCLYDKFIRPTNYAYFEEWKHDYTNATSWDIAVEELRELLADHILVGQGLHQVLNMLGVIHPEKLKREISTFVRNKLRADASLHSMNDFVRAVFVKSIEPAGYSIPTAQAAVALYKKFQAEWESYIRDAFGGVDVVQNTLHRFKAQNSRKADIFAKVPPKRGLAQFVSFEYDRSGRLLTPLTKTKNTKDHDLALEDMGIVSVAVKLIVVGSGSQRDSAVARVSAVNVNGYCLYDKFIKPKDTGGFVDYQTCSTGIREKDLKQGVPRSVVIRELQTLLQSSHLLICNGWKDGIGILLQDSLPKDCNVRDTNVYVRKRLGLSKGSDFSEIVKEALYFHLKKEESSSITDAQAAMLLYRMYQTEWEKSIQKPNDDGETPAATIDTHLENLGIGDWQPGNGLMNALTLFKYNHYGKPLAQLVPFEKRHMKMTKVVGLACEMVDTGPRTDHALARVSVVNEYGFRVYDSFVQPKWPVRLYRTTVNGIHHGDLKNAPPFPIVATEVKHHLRDHIVVGHYVHRELALLELSDYPEITLRDVSSYFQMKERSSAPIGLKKLVGKYLHLDIHQDGVISSIENAQAAMALYQLEKDKWENYIETGDNA